MPSLIYRFVFSLLLASLLCGCKQEGPPSAPAQAGGQKQPLRVLVWPLSASITSFDPSKMTTSPEATVARQLFDTLVRLDQGLSLAPGIARKWEIDPTGREYTFHLQPNLVFHDSSALGAREIKRSLERLAGKGEATYLAKHLKLIEGHDAFLKGQTQDIRGIQVLDPLRLRIRLSRPHSPFLFALSIYQAGIISVPEGASRGSGFQPVVGSGPFMLEAADDQSIVMRPFPRFIDGAPRIDRLVFKVYAGADIKRAAKDFLAGELSAVPMVGLVKDMLHGKSEYKVVRRHMIGVFFYGFNMHADARLTSSMRKRIAQAIDKRVIAEEINHNAVNPAETMIPMGLPGYRPSVRAPGPAYARFPTEPLPKELRMLSVIRNPTVQAEMDCLARWLRPLGTELRVEYVLDWDAFYKRLQAGDCDMFRLAWYPDTPDLDEVFFPLFHSQGEYNYFGYADPRVDALLEKARAITRLEERIALYHQAEDLILADLPAIPIWYEAMDRAVQLNVRGLNWSPLGEAYTSLASVWIE